MSSVDFSEEIRDAANRGNEETLLELSKTRYIKTYNAFVEWKQGKGKPDTCNTVLMAYFMKLADEGKKASSMWAYYSMLKSMIRLREKIDIGRYFDLTAFLKRKADGYEPTKSFIFEDYEMQRFLVTADDTLWLDVKVMCIFGMFGLMRGGEFIKLTVKNVCKQGDVYIVWMVKPKNKETRYFVISGSCCDVVKKYIDLRPEHTESDRFFMNYKNGKCVNQVIGKDKFKNMPRRIAEFLQLPDVEKYTSHSFRRSAASMYANSGAKMDAVKNIGGWKSTKVAEGYVVNSLSYKKRASNTFSALLTKDSVTTSSTAESPSITFAKQRKIEATCTTVSRSTQQSVSYEIENSEEVEQSEQYVSSQGYSEVPDEITDADMMSLDVIQKPNVDDHSPERSVSSQGYVRTEHDNITDSELAGVADPDSSNNAVNSVPRNFTFSNCTITINFKN